MLAPDINYPFGDRKTYVFYLEDGNIVTGECVTIDRKDEFLTVSFRHAAETDHNFLGEDREFELCNYNEDEIVAMYIRKFGGNNDSRLTGFKQIDLSGIDIFGLRRLSNPQKDARKQILRAQRVEFQHGFNWIDVNIDDHDEVYTVAVHYDGQMFPRNNWEDYFNDSVIGIYRTEEVLQDEIAMQPIKNEPMIITIAPTGHIQYYKKSTFMRLCTNRQNVLNLEAKDPWTRLDLTQFYIMPWMNEVVEPPRKRARHSAEAAEENMPDIPGAALGGTLKKRRRRRNTRRRY